jgi:hypothetical protein
VTRTRRIAPALPALLLALACATPEARPERTVILQSAPPTIVLLPLNVTAALPEELAEASPRVFRALQRYLEAHGAHLKTLAFPVARTLWTESIREAQAAQQASGRAAHFDDAARVFVGKLAQYAEFDDVVVASLFVQGARISGRTARWDGTEQVLRIEEGLWAGQLGEEPPFGGSVPAASLHAAVLDARGDVIQQGQAGLAVLVGLRLAGRPELGTPRAEFVDLPDPLSDRDAILTAIARALAPFLSPLAPDQIAAPMPRP